uniref:Putative secreted protein n=1 Tax=Anopheles darlingi TaxID=43151 RepID=A0A2M4DR36_ANODA
MVWRARVRVQLLMSTHPSAVVASFNLDSLQSPSLFYVPCHPTNHQPQTGTQRHPFSRGVDELRLLPLLWLLPSDGWLHAPRTPLQVCSQK